MKASKETDLVRACLQYLKLRGVFAWRNNSTGIFDPTRKVFRTFSGLKGVSDILGCLPSGRFLALEAKVGKNLLSPDQAAFLDTVRQLGGVAAEVRSLDDLEKLLSEILP